MRPAADFGQVLHAEVQCRGCARAHQVVVLGDAALWILNLAQEHFPQAVQVVDLYPTRRHLYDLARLPFPVTTDASHRRPTSRLAELRRDRDAAGSGAPGEGWRRAPSCASNCWRTRNVHLRSRESCPLQIAPLRSRSRRSPSADRGQGSGGHSVTNTGSAFLRALSQGSSTMDFRSDKCSTAWHGAYPDTDPVLVITSTPRGVPPPGLRTTRAVLAVIRREPCGLAVPRGCRGLSPRWHALRSQLLRL